MKVNSIIPPHISSKRKAFVTQRPLVSGMSHNPSFKSIPLYDVSVFRTDKSGLKTKFPANFSRVTPEDINDYRAMLGMMSKLRPEDIYGHDICSNFITHTPSLINYFVVDTKEEGLPLKERILSMAEVEIWDYKNRSFPRHMDVNYLQSLHIVPRSKFEDTKGGGELCLYGLVKLAKERDLDYVFLRSARNAFYDHIQFGEKEYILQGTTYRLKKENYDDFLKRVEEKYGFKSEE